MLVDNTNVPPREVLVCHAGTCMAHGAEAVLTEIEELVRVVGAPSATVRPVGCLGYCNQAPNAVVVDRGARRIEQSNVHRTIQRAANSHHHLTPRLPHTCLAAPDRAPPVGAPVSVSSGLSQSRYWALPF